MSGTGDGPIELGLTEINAINELPITIAGGIGSGGGGANATNINKEIRDIKIIDAAANKLIETLDTHYKAELTENSKILMSAIEFALAELEASSNNYIGTPVRKFSIRLEAISKLLALKNTELEAQKNHVNAYFNRDPLTDSRKNVVGTFGTQLGRQGRDRNHISFTHAYQAAYAAKLIQEQIALLTALATANQQALTEAQQIQSAHQFSASASAAIAGPQLVTTAGTVIAMETPSLSLRAAISTAIAALRGLAASVGAGLIVGVSALFYSPKLANSELPERFAFSMPLADLLPETGQDLQAIAAASGTIDLPYRISSKAAIDGLSEIFVVNTDGKAIPSSVRVVAATFDAQQNVYTVTTTDTPPRTLTWTPVVEPVNSSTVTPITQVEPAIYPGATVTPVEGRLDTYPEISDASLDDFITVFPAGSGIPPIYTMFRDRREDPGVVTGKGQVLTGNWLDAASKGEGAAIPAQIADRMRGQEFKNFREFREAFWRAVAETPQLANQFKAASLSEMKHGKSPFVRFLDQVGNRSKAELHHIKFISQGGAVYDVDNLVVMTPKQHIALHSGADKNG